MLGSRKRIIALVPQNRPHLHIKIGVILGQRQADQVRANTLLLLLENFLHHLFLICLSLAQRFSNIFGVINHFFHTARCIRIAKAVHFRT